MAERKLSAQGRGVAGIGKTKEVETLSANDALLEALCFGWIDGVMKYILQEVFLRREELAANGHRKTRRWFRSWKQRGLNMNGIIMSL